MALTNPSPKTRFQTLASTVKAHRDLIDKPEFDRACDFAQLQYQGILSQNATTFNDAAMNHFKITGAQEFLAVLRNLGETTHVPTKVDADNLRHS